MIPVLVVCLTAVAVCAPVLSMLARALRQRRDDGRDEACRKIHDKYYK
jgi:hypothetical protein